MSRISVVAIVFTGLLPGLAQGSPHRGPEHQKLQAWVGQWTSKGEYKETALTSAKKQSSRIRAEWFEGGFSVVRHGETEPDLKFLDLILFNPVTRTYEWSGVVSDGSDGTVTLKQQGDRWTYEIEDRLKGLPVKVRGIYSVLSPDLRRFTQEFSQDAGRTWHLFFEATDTRLAAQGR